MLDIIRADRTQNGEEEAPFRLSVSGPAIRHVLQKSWVFDSFGPNLVDGELGPERDPEDPDLGGLIVSLLVVQDLLHEEQRR